MSLAEETPQVGPDAPDSDELLERFKRWDKALDQKWGTWLEETETAFDFVAGHQWDDADKKQLEDSGRAPVTFNRIATTIDAVSGAEITGRQQVIYEPRQATPVNVSAQNEVLTKAADWVRDECDAEHEESEAARDCLICGVGWTETRPDYEEDPEGRIIIERIDPTEILADSSSRKPNFADKRYLRRRRKYAKEEFERMWPEASADDDGDPYKRPVVVDPETSYTSGSDADEDSDEVQVTEYQWFDPEPVYRAAIPQPDGTTKIHMLPPDQHAQAKAQFPQLQSVKQTTRVYYRAIVASGEIIDGPTKLDTASFTYKAMTGKRDRNAGTWYGLVRAMLDPQRFANKFFVQILHILNTNAKGGLMAEMGAFVDQKAAEDTWSDPAAITWLADGALSSPNGRKIEVKQAPAYPQGQDRLMEVATNAIRDVTGVNQEMLGLADRQQPGILEHQRKQAAYGILSAFFDAFRRYRKEQGRLLLASMKLYLPPSYLVRIVGEDGSPAYQAIGSAFADDTLKFNVIVDDTPAGPNEKTQVWQMIIQMLPMLQQANLGADFWAAIMDYSPLPTALASKLKQLLMAMAQAPPSPEQQQALQQGQAKTADLQASAQHHSAQAALLNSEAQGSKQGALDAQAKKDIAAAANSTMDAMAKSAALAQPNDPQLY